MGVFGLETFLHKDMPNAYCYYVRIKELAEKYTEETGKHPVILVDGTNWLRTSYDKTDNHWILGGQLKEFVENTKTFVKAFQNIGVRSHFYFGGTTPESKRETWISRRNTNIKKIIDVFNKIKNNSDYSWNYLLPPIVGAMGRFAPRFECDCDISVTQGEVDVEIARCAWEHGSFAILSQDTDYVLMDGAKYYLSLKHLDLDTMTTVTYNREGLLQALQLQLHELHLLGPLMSNEKVPLWKVNNFHKKLCPRQTTKTDIFELLPRIVRYIKGKNIPNDGNYQYLHAIAVDVFENEQMARDLETAMKNYLHTSENTRNGEVHFSMPSEEKWYKILQKAKDKSEHCDVTAHLYPLMLGEAYEFSVALEDYSNGNLFPTAKMYLPLRQRIYGILLYEKPNTTFVKEWCIQGKTCPKQASEVPIQWVKDIELIHPGLLKLWSEDCSDDIKWKLFIENLTVNSKLDIRKIKNLGFPYAVPVAVLFYLVHENEKLLTETEMDVILIQAAVLQCYTAAEIKAMKSQLLCGPTKVKRVVEISTVFLRGAALVLFLLAACGFSLAEVMPWFYFDGKLLLDKYVNVVSKNKRPSELCEDKPQIYKIYKEMRDLVMPDKSWRN